MNMLNMNRAVLYARNFLKNTSPNCSLVQLTAFTQPRLRFYAADSDSSKLPNTQKNSGSIDVEDVSNQGKSFVLNAVIELERKKGKKRITI